MRIKIERTKEERMLRHEARKQWHEWFAWHPIFIEHELVWLETVERKRCYPEHVSLYITPWWRYR
jgi:hypothetical protein